MGRVLSGIFGTSSDFRANTGGQNFAQNIANAQTNYDQNLQNQNNLAQTLLQQSQGVGPNPAQAMLNQATDNNIKANTSMIASQRGMSPGLAQRLIAQNAANTSQQAAGQAATLNSQQQLNAQNGLANLYGQIGSQGLQNQQIQQGALASNNQVNAGIEAANTASSNALTGGLLNGVGGFLGQRKANGGFVEGPEVVPGDSEKNDVVPVLASGGEIVIPKTASSSPERAKAFIDHLMKNNKDESRPEGYAQVVELRNRLKRLEKKVGVA